MKIAVCGLVWMTGKTIANANYVNRQLCTGLDLCVPLVSVLFDHVPTRPEISDTSLIDKTFWHVFSHSVLNGTEWDWQGCLFFFGWIIQPFVLHIEHTFERTLSEWEIIIITTITTTIIMIIVLVGAIENIAKTHFSV